MTTLEQEAQNFKREKVVKNLKGIYYHKESGTYIKVLGNTNKHILIKWGDNEVAHALSFLDNFIKIDIGENRTLH